MTELNYDPSNYLDQSLTTDLKFIHFHRKSNAYVFMGVHKGDDCIIRVKPTINSDFGKNVFEGESETTLENDRFHKFMSSVKSSCELYVICPATEEDKRKVFGTQTRRTIESYDEYVTNVLPKIENQDIGWIQNILNGKSEQESILYDDEHFVLLPDPKWDYQNLDELYCLAIVRESGIRSIRDLSEKHLPMLESIYQNGVNTIKEKFDIDSGDLRVYFHYHPSFWHLHVHFTLIKNFVERESIGHAHSILQVIENIKICPNYYQLMPLEIIGKSAAI